ncbi:MAG: DUF3472 domain-containing protein [Kiritimatiellae bacterium]|nr:DUF3472 domain-containing protein [Kiritimatiellia bacterium]
MKIAVACGGTGGHAFPGLAVAEELKARGHDVTVWESGRDVESSVMRSWSGKGFSTHARQLSVKNAFAILCSYFRCRKEIKKEMPDAMLAMGSYSSLPPVLAAHRSSVPVVLHEANTVPGRAVDFLSRFAKVVATSFESTASRLKLCKCELSGLPVRAEIANGKRFGNIPGDAFVIFVTGGSQGAHAVNMLASEAIVLMHAELAKRRDGSEKKLYVIHQTGLKDEGDVMGVYANAGIPARVNGFEKEMANCFASASIVVARAGASTCFELAACGKPALLIPLPSALRNHQHWNADAFVSAGAADEAVQAKFSSRQLCHYLLDKFAKPERLAAMGERMKALATPDAAKKVADIVEKVASKALILAVCALIALGGAQAADDANEAAPANAASAKAVKPMAARSVHLRYPQIATNAVMAEVTMNVTSLQTNSYYMALGWNAGYCGLQHLKDAGNVLIFSVWEPGDPFDFSVKPDSIPEERRAKALYANELVRISRFGYEGTGVQAMAGVQQWQPGDKVQFRIASEKDGDNRVAYTCFFRRVGAEDWIKVATISTICPPEKRFLSHLHSFVEDFWRNGESVNLMRRAEYSDIRSYDAAGNCVKAKVALFSGDETQLDNIDAGRTAENAFYLQTGGDTKKHTPLMSWIWLD